LVAQSTPSSAEAISASVSASTSGLVDELTNDWQNHRRAMITKGVLATAAGVGLGMLCSRAPV
jgi:hypothetical protein